MTTGIQTVMYPVTDLTAAKQLFTTLLGTDPYMDEPYYVGFAVEGQDIGLDPNGAAKGMTGPVAYWHVEDLDATIASLVDAGATVAHPASDVGGGKLIATIIDHDGNALGLLQPAPAGAWG